ncbi:MAG: hypothetical protein COB85_00210 [Bacteroidetes bacterium]|nr:MAG: hypothetical protein COB85_00210 [Bacteroidota bacterium]
MVKLIEEENRVCPECGEVFEGRIDKKFCSHYCKSAFHYVRNKRKEDTMFKKIDIQLKHNRRVLRDYNKAGKAVVRKEILLAEGFNPKFFTHYWKNSDGDVYLFCYEFGFLSKKEHMRDKYVLVQWQDYMG